MDWITTAEERLGQLLHCKENRNGDGIHSVNVSLEACKPPKAKAWALLMSSVQPNLVL